MHIQLYAILTFYFLIVASSVQLCAQNVLLSEDFEDGVVPPGWTQQTNATDGGWIAGTNTTLQSQYWSIAPHGNIIATNDDECDCDKSQDYLIMPAFDLSNVSAVILEFENYFDGGSLFGGTEEATIEYSLNNGNTWTVLETIVGTDNDSWDEQTINLSALIGNSNVLIAFRYFDDNEWLFGWAIDDVLVYEPTGFDAELTSLDMPSTTSAPGSLMIEGTVANVGITVINNFDVHWMESGATYSTSIGGLSLSAGQSYQFSHPDQLTISATGSFSIDVYIDNINGTSDDDPNNDSLSTAVSAVEYGVFSDGNLLRDYIYYHPSTAPPDCPLVFVCHGYTGTAQDIMDFSEMNAVADQFGFAVCYPQGIEDSFNNTFFNVGYDFQINETVDDVAFLENLTTYLMANNSLDPTRVFCTGFSNGADLCYLLACEASETFRAVAPVAGMIRQEILDVCTPPFPVSICEIHGTDDNVTYWAGDPNNIDNWGAYPSIPATIEFWKDLHGLQLTSSANLPDIDPNDGSTVSIDKYGLAGQCPQVWLYTIDGGGHDWPGAWGNMDIHASYEVWDFFSQICTDNTTSITSSLTPSVDRTLLKVVDITGRETNPLGRQVLIYIFSDGTAEKRLILE